VSDEPPAGALPLHDAMQRWVPIELQRPVARAFAALEREGRHVWRLTADGRRVDELDLTSPHNAGLIAAVRAAQDACHRWCETELRAGRLVAWGRVGSPLAPMRRVPADAWHTLRLTNVESGEAAGGGAVVFGLHLAERAAEAEAVPAPAEPAAPIVAPPPAPSPPARAGLAEARAWMAAHVLTARERWKREAAIAACVAATGCRRDDARAAWGELPETVRGRAGRPRPANPNNSAK
jgi:hypothetical protein